MPAGRVHVEDVVVVELDRTLRGQVAVVEDDLDVPEPLFLALGIARERFLVHPEAREVIDEEFLRGAVLPLQPI